MLNKLLCETRSYSGETHTHYHSYCQLILPINGKLIMKTNVNEVSVDEEHLFFLPSQCVHSYSSNYSNKFLVIDIPEKMTFSILENAVKSELYETLDEKWKAIRYLLIEESKRNNKRALNDLVTYAVGLLREDYMPPSIQYIHENIDKPISIKTLASMENYSVSHYIEWFAAKTGMTPNVYIQNLRIKEAKKYLLNTDLSLLTISELLGYEHQASLTRLFKKYENMTPNEYRQLNKNNGQKYLNFG